MNREAIYSALWQKIGEVDGFVTKSRRLQHWNDVDRYAQPALFMAQGGQTALTTTGENSKWVLRADIYIYVQTAGEAPAPLLNPLRRVLPNIGGLDLSPILSTAGLSADTPQICVDPRNQIVLGILNGLDATAARVLFSDHAPDIWGRHKKRNKEKGPGVNPAQVGRIGGDNPIMRRWPPGHRRPPGRR